MSTYLFVGGPADGQRFEPPNDYSAYSHADTWYYPFRFWVGSSALTVFVESHATQLSILQQLIDHYKP